MFFSVITKNSILIDKTGLTMKNFNILSIHWKIWLLGGSSWKTVIKGGGLLKKGAWIVSRFKRGLGRKEEGSVFELGWYPDAHYTGFCLLSNSPPFSHETGWYTNQN